MAKAKAYGFEDLVPEFFDPRTYGVPPPPLIHGLGENVSTHWAPSLKHRDEHHPDPPEYKDEWRDFEEKLKADARAKNAEKNKVQSQVPAGPTPSGRPSQAPSRPAASAQQLRPAGSVPGGASKDDATPPPTRNPLLARKPAPPPPSETGADEPVEEESSVELSDDVMSVDGNSTMIKENPLNAGRKPGAPGSGSRPPVRPPPPKR
jgi:pilus assembly protein CpaF